MKGLIVLAAIVLCGCETRASDFRDEMEAKSSRSGLAVGRIGGSWLHVTPLGGGLLTEPKYQGSPENNLGPCRICPGWFSANGNRITWWNLQLLKQRAETTLSVTTITGEPVSTWTGDLYTPVAVALSQDGSKVALEVQRYDLDIPGSGLQYVTFGVKDMFLSSRSRLSRRRMIAPAWAGHQTRARLCTRDTARSLPSILIAGNESSWPTVQIQHGRRMVTGSRSPL